jgi:hypothetical protein
MSVIIPVAESIAHWLRHLCGLLWAVAFLGSILFAVLAFSIQRDRRAEHSIDAKFEKDLSDVYDAVEKDPEASRYYSESWRDLRRERCRADFSAAEAYRWQTACNFWMLATGCALAAIVMLYVSK